MLVIGLNASTERYLMTLDQRARYIFHKRESVISVYSKQKVLGSPFKNQYMMRFSHTSSLKLLMPLKVCIPSRMTATAFMLLALCRWWSRPVIFQMLFLWCFWCFWKYQLEFTCDWKKIIMLIIQLESFCDFCCLMYWEGLLRLKELTEISSHVGRA